MAKDIVSSAGVTYNSLTNGSKIVGKIVADSDFRIDGEVEGDIVCKGKVIVGLNGYLKGSISCFNAEIIGKVIGNLEATECLTLRSTAVFQGDIRIKTLMVEPNAVLNGSCSMHSNTISEK